MRLLSTCPSSSHSSIMYPLPTHHPSIIHHSPIMPVCIHLSIIHPPPFHPPSLHSWIGHTSFYNPFTYHPSTHNHQSIFPLYIHWAIYHPCTHPLSLHLHPSPVPILLLLFSSFMHPLSIYLFISSSIHVSIHLPTQPLHWLIQPLTYHPSIHHCQAILHPFIHPPVPYPSIHSFPI